MSPSKRVMTLYTHLLSNLRQAKAFLHSGDVEARQHRLFKAMDATEILLSALDFEAGGDIARHLEGIYTYFLRRIIHVDTKEDVEALEQIITMVERLQEAWSTAADMIESSPQAAAI